MTAQLQPVIIQPGAGQELHAFGNTLSVFLSGEQTNGILSVTSELIAPGGGPPQGGCALLSQRRHDARPSLDHHDSIRL